MGHIGVWLTILAVAVLIRPWWVGEPLTTDVVLSRVAGVATVYLVVGGLGWWWRHR